MIKSIELENFQSHAATRVDLHPGLNAIVGPSDKGKSAILRGLYWVHGNRPSGTGIVSDWAKNAKGKQVGDCRVTVVTGGSEVTRIRTAKLNAYRVDKVELEAVKTDVPDSVAAALNLTDVNFQRQLDAPFLLSASPGEIGRFLNRVVRLEEIDATASLAQSRKRETEQSLKAECGSLEALAVRQEALSWLGGAEATLCEIEAAEASLRRDSASLDSLSTIVDAARRLAAELQSSADIPAAAASLAELEAFAEKMRTADAKVDDLVDALAYWGGVQIDLRSTEALCAAAPDADWLQAAADKMATVRATAAALTGYSGQVRVHLATLDATAGLVALEADADWLQAAASKMETVRQRFTEVAAGAYQATRHGQSIQSADEEQRLLEALLPDTCPACGSPMPGTTEGHSHG